MNKVYIIGRYMQNCIGNFSIYFATTKEWIFILIIEYLKANAKSAIDKNIKIVVCEDYKNTRPISLIDYKYDKDCNLTNEERKFLFELNISGKKEIFAEKMFNYYSIHFVDEFSDIDYFDIHLKDEKNLSVFKKYNGE